jgi:hypothetical protein
LRSISGAQCRRGHSRLVFSIRMDPCLPPRPGSKIENDNEFEED